ncbi:MAG: acyltransferase family protein [Leucobacter sp.]
MATKVARRDPVQDVPAPTRSSSPVRTDIQGLRAIAVALVLVYHLTPVHLSGGYIGVDVFFVISGFLITAHLLREIARNGTVDLPKFWARRARRLLPAALLVIGVTLVGVWIVAPSGFVPSFFAQLAASAAYVQNWVLAGQAVDYMAVEAQASPVQHYWSLSVEEQFYIVWPVVAVVAALIATRLAKRQAPVRFARPSARTVFTALIGLVAVASLIYSILLTSRDPAAAYFVTTTRAWEFAIGGLLAVIATAPAAPLERIGQRTRSVLTWVGLAGIGLSAVFYTDSTPFPGYTALLPVLGTALVIIGADPTPKWSPRAFLASRPMQWLGDVSYSVYLWHFPLIVLLPFLTGRPIGFVDGVAITAATLLLAWGSKVLIEDPFRTGAARNWTNLHTLGVTAAVMSGVLVVSVIGLNFGEQRVTNERDEVSSMLLSQDDPCLGASALDSGEACDPTPTTTPVPDPALADKAPDECLSEIAGSELVACHYGAERQDAERTIALVGDSHAEQWLTALTRVAEQEQWRLLVMTKASCPFTTGERDYISMSDSANEELRQACADWNDKALQAIEQDPQIDTVITSAKATNRVVTKSGESWRDAASHAYLERWAELPDAVRSIVVIRDTPQMSKDVLSCVTESGEEAAKDCAVPATEAFDEDPMAEAVETVDNADETAADETTVDETTTDEVAAELIDREVALLDLSDYFVVEDDSPPVIGGVLAFRDSHHLSWAYSEMLADPLADQLKATLPPAEPQAETDTIPGTEALTPVE